MTIQKDLHPRDDRANALRKGGRGHATMKDCIDTSIQGLEDYIKKSKEGINYSS